MLGVDTFSSVFGGSPEHTRSHYVEHIRAVVRAGYSPVLCLPGTDVAGCTLGVQAARRAPRGHRHQDEVLDDPGKAGTVMKRFLDAHGGVNIGLHLGRSNLAVLQFDEDHPAPTLLTPEGDQVWYTDVPDQLVHLRGPSWQLLAGDRYCLVPPAQQPEGAYRLVGGTIPAPAWMTA